MKSNRLALFALLVVAAAGLAGCSNSSTNKTDADVFLSQSDPTPPSSVNMAVNPPVDVVIASLTITSTGKTTTEVLSQQDDVILNQEVVTCSRSDGGTVVSPQWTNNNQIYVPHGGSVGLTNFPIMPAEYFQQPPLNQLLCSGCLDKETNNPNIRQTLHVTLYGKEVSGKKISLEFDVSINFYYQ